MKIKIPGERTILPGGFAWARCPYCDHLNTVKDSRAFYGHLIGGRKVKKSKKVFFVFSR